MEALIRKYDFIVGYINQRRYESALNSDICQYQPKEAHYDFCGDLTRLANINDRLRLQQPRLTRKMGSGVRKA